MTSMDKQSRFMRTGFVPLGALSGFMPITRRTFLVGALAAPVVAAAQNPPHPWSKPEDLAGLRFTEDSAGLTILRPPVYQRDFGATDPLAVRPVDDGHSWRIQRRVLGPEAQFLLKVMKPGTQDVSPIYQLDALHVRLGNLGEATHTFIFEKIKEVWTVKMKTTLWTRVAGGKRDLTSAALPFDNLKELRPQDPEHLCKDRTPSPDGKPPARTADRFVFSCDGQYVHKALDQLFEGHVSARDPITLEFDSNGVWYISGSGRGAILANAFNVTLDEIECAWCEQVRSPEKVKGRRSIKDRGEERPSDDPVFHASAVVVPLNRTSPPPADEPGAAPSPPSKPAAKKVPPTVYTHTLTLGASPSATIATESDIAWRYLRRTWKNEPKRWKPGIARIASDWRLMLRAKGRVLLGQLDTTGAVLEARRVAGSTELEMRFTSGLDVTPQLIRSPLGKLRVRGRDEKSSQAQQVSTGPAVSVRLLAPSGTAGASAAKVDSIEINLLLLHADLALEDVEFSELSFAPSNLHILYGTDLASARQDLARLASYLWLDTADPTPLPYARIDLSRARLSASRSHDLVSLAFLFSGLRLDVFKGKTWLAHTRGHCSVIRHGDPADKAEDDSWRLSDLREDRPVLVVEFPPQHVFEECVFRPDPPALPDVELKEHTFDISSTDVPAATWARMGGKPLTLPTEGRAFVEKIADFCAQDRAALRGAYSRKKIKQENAPAHKPSEPVLNVTFGEFAAAFERGSASAASAASTVSDVSAASGVPAASCPETAVVSGADDETSDKPPACLSQECRVSADLPADQLVYIGPFGMDPDAAAWARKLNLCLQATVIKYRAGGMLDIADQLMKDITTPPPATPAATRRSNFLQAALDWIKGHKDSDPSGATSDEERFRRYERVAEATITGYQDFRDFYRLEMTRLYFDATYRETYSAPSRYEPKLDLPWKPTYVPTDTTGSQIDFFSKSHPGALPVDEYQVRLDRVLDRYVAVVTERSDLPARMRARLANPSRLAFRLDCAPRPSRAACPLLEASPDRDVSDSFLSVGTRLPFSLAALTDWSLFEMAVCPRAMQIPRFDEGGEVIRIEAGAEARPIDSARQDDDAPAAAKKRNDERAASDAIEMLRLLGMRSSPSLTAAERLADVEASLKVAPGRLETAIEMPARIVLSPSQSAVWRTPASKLRTPLDFGALRSPASRPPNVAMWSAELLEASPNPMLRAVHSPDLRPGFVRGAVQSSAGSEQPTSLPVPGSAASAASATVPTRLLHGPANLAPPRGPRAPWTLGIEDADFGTSSIADVRAATGAAGGVDCPASEASAVAAPPAPADPASPVSGASGGAPASGASQTTVINYPLLPYLCQRKVFKETEYGADGIFRSSLDAYDRHEIVVLSSAWGLPVRGRREGNGQLQDTQASSQIEPPRDWRPIDLDDGSAIYQPRPLQLQELRLSALGGTLRHETDFVPPASARHIVYGSLFDALSVERWQHWIVLGRDEHAEVVYKGFLFPIGHRASLVKQTERVFLRRKDCERVRAYLRQRMFIRIGRPDKLFPAQGHPNAGRQFPPRLVHMLTQNSPDIVDPTEDSANSSSPSPAGRLFADEPGLVFWPRTARIEGTDVQFDMLFDTATTKAPLIFVDNIAANRVDLLKKLIAYYNNAQGQTGGIPSPDSFDPDQDIPVVDASIHLRTLDLNGQAMRYCDENKPGGATHKSVCWTLKASGGVGNAPTKNDPNLPNFEGSNDYFNDPSLAAADQPPFYPALETARIRLDQIERLVNGGPQLTVVQFDGFYVANGFAPATQKVGANAAAKDQQTADVPFTDSREIYLNILNNVSMSAGTSGDRTGAVVHPELLLAGLSRTCGPLGGARGGTAAGPLRPGTLFSIAGRYTVKSPVASQAQVRHTPPGIALAAVPTGLSGGSPDSAVAMVFENFFHDEKTQLLGFVSMKKLASSLLVNVANEYLPKLRDTVEYALAGVEASSDAVRTQIIVPLTQTVSAMRRQWLAIDSKLQSTGGAIAPLHVGVRDVFPDVDSALADLEVALVNANAGSDAATMVADLSAVYESGRRLIDAIARVVANPIDRVLLRLQQELSAFLEKLNPTLTLVWSDRDDNAITLWLDDTASTPKAGSANALLILPTVLPALPDASVLSPGAVMGHFSSSRFSADDAIEHARAILNQFPAQAQSAIDVAFKAAVPRPDVPDVTVLAVKCWRTILDSAQTNIDKALNALNEGPTENPSITTSINLLNTTRAYCAQLKARLDASLPNATNAQREAALLRLSALLRTATMVRQIRNGQLDVFRALTDFTQNVLPLFLPVDPGFVLAPIRQAAEKVADQLGAFIRTMREWRDRAGGKFRLSPTCTTCDGLPDPRKTTGSNPWVGGVVRESLRALLKSMDQLPENLKASVARIRKEFEDATCDLECALQLWNATLDRLSTIDWKSAVKATNEQTVLASLQIGPISDTVAQAGIAMRQAIKTGSDIVDKLNGLPDAVHADLEKMLFSYVVKVLESALVLLEEVNDGVCDIASDLLSKAGQGAATDSVTQIKKDNDKVISDAQTALKSCKTLKDLASAGVLNIKLSVDPFPGGADKAVAEAAIVQLPKTLLDRIARCRDNLVATTSDVVNGFASKIAYLLFRDPAADGKPLPLNPNVMTVYAALLQERDAAWATLGGDRLTQAASGLLVVADPSACFGLDPGRIPSPYKLDEKNDQLALDVESLRKLGALLNPDKPLPEPALRYVLRLLHGWQDGSATPLRIVQQLRSLSTEAIRTQLLALVDFNAMRDAIETQIKMLVPSRMTTSFEFEAVISTAASAATGGIFQPLNNCGLRIVSTTSIDLLDPKTPPKISSVGDLGAFDIALVGSFEAVTLHFAGARFETDGGSPTCDLRYAGFSIGAELQFLQDLAPFLGSAKGSGFYLRPLTSGFGLEAGYELNLGIISIGNLAFFNVSVNAAARLRFDDKKATFLASLSRRDSPFTIAVAPYGGSGFFGLEADGQGVVGFEASFEYGGAAAFAYGPLTGYGRIMTGVYIRSGRGKPVDLSATFYAGGSASIWIFNFGASLSVIAQQSPDGTRMNGTATFRFSFSMGIVHYDYSVNVHCSISWGGGGQKASEKNDDDQAFDELEPAATPVMLAFADAPRDDRYAVVSDVAPALVPVRAKAVSTRAAPRATVRVETYCESENWGAYKNYFDLDLRRGVDFP
jgi:hypothetical protein